MRRAIVSISVAALAIVLIGYVPGQAVSSSLVIHGIDYDRLGTDGSESSRSRTSRLARPSVTTRFSS